MAARAYWKGHLKLSLVTIGVELYSAVSRSRKLTLHQIHRPSNKRVRHQKVVPGVGPVEQDEIVKGYEISKDNYILFEPEELDQIKLETRHTIDLVQFVEHCEIDPRYFDRPYYVVPVDSEVAHEGFSVLRAALSGEKKVAIGQIASRGRDNIIAIRACGEGLLLETLRYPDELRESDRIFEGLGDTDVSGEMLSMATELIERKSAPFDPQAFSSRYMAALRDLIDEKREKGEVAQASGEEPASRQDNVVDLMQALKDSVARDKKSTAKRKGGRSGSRSKQKKPQSKKKAS